MARIAGVNIPTAKRVFIALQYIYGVGPFVSRKICDALQIPDEKRVHQLTESEVIRIREEIDRSFMVEGDLRRQVSQSIKRLIDIQCYRGTRHRKGLPARGQRTHTNARTRKRKS